VSFFACEGIWCGGIAGRRRLLLVGLERWGDGARRQQSWLCQSGSRASAFQKREGTAALLECESLLSLCGGGKLASWGGVLGVDRGGGDFSWLGLSVGVMVRDASRAGFPKAEAELRALEKRHDTAALLECESLLSLCGGGKLASWGGAFGVDCGNGELLVVGLGRWGDGERRQQAGFAKAEAELRALEKREGTAALLECESLLSLCGGGKLASWGGALGVDRGSRSFAWSGLSVGVVASDPKAEAELRVLENRLGVVAINPCSAA